MARSFGLLRTSTVSRLVAEDGRRHRPLFVVESLQRFGQAGTKVQPDANRLLSIDQSRSRCFQSRPGSPDSMSGSVKPLACLRDRAGQVGGDLLLRCEQFVELLLKLPLRSLRFHMSSSGPLDLGMRHGQRTFMRRARFGQRRRRLSLSLQQSGAGFCKLRHGNVFLMLAGARYAMSDTLMRNYALLQVLIRPVVHLVMRVRASCCMAGAVCERPWFASRTSAMVTPARGWCAARPRRRRPPTAGRSRPRRSRRWRCRCSAARKTVRVRRTAPSATAA